MKDNEVYGSEGTSYTAEFWQYDSRTGRRWNLDPVDKPWQSRYSTFSGNPIARVDPKGDDDYFNSAGRLIKRTKTGSNIYVQTAKDNQFILLTQVSLATAPSRRAVANVIGHYADQAGITFQWSGSTENTGSGFVGLATNSEGKTSEENPAFYRSSDKSIRMNMAGGKLNSKMYDYNNLLSVLVHENDHKERDENSMIDANIGHMSHSLTYFKGVANDYFINGTDDFQGGILGSMAKEMTLALKEGHSENEVYDLAVRTNTAIAKTGFRLTYTKPMGAGDNGTIGVTRVAKKE